MHSLVKKINTRLAFVYYLNGNTSSPMGNDRSPERQHNVGDTIIYDAQRQTVFNLGNFKWDHFHSISDENKTESSISPFT